MYFIYVLSTMMNDWRRPLFILSILCTACDDSSGIQDRLTYDVDGPVGIIRTAGPWLVRVGVPTGIDASSLVVGVQRNETMVETETEVLPVREGEQESSKMIGNLLTLPLLSTGRRDTFLVLIPAQELGEEIKYALYKEDVILSPIYAFRELAPRRGQETEVSSARCEVYVEFPDPKLPVSADYDQALQAGIQLRFSARVFPLRDGQLDIAGGTSLMGVATFEWLEATEQRSVSDGTVTPIRGGLARTAPFTTPLGEQKLLVTAHTSRWGRCESTTRYSSL